MMDHHSQLDFLTTAISLQEQLKMLSADMLLRMADMSREDSDGIAMDSPLSMKSTRNLISRAEKKS